jgi:hypothetical protein
MLDEFELTNVGFVKIDVEGHELAVLRGASKLIERERPNVFVEVDQSLHSGDDIEDVFSYFAERSYTGSFFAQRAWLPLGVFDRDEARRAADRNKSTGMLRATLVPSKRHIHNYLFRPGNSKPPLRPLT